MTGLAQVPTADDARRAAEVLLQAGVGTVLLYGSVARGDATEHSDIDLIAIYDNIDYDQRREMASQLARSSQRRCPAKTACNNQDLRHPRAPAAIGT